MLSNATSKLTCSCNLTELMLFSCSLRLFLLYMGYVSYVKRSDHLFGINCAIQALYLLLFLLLLTAKSATGPMFYKL